MAKSGGPYESTSYAELKDLLRECRRSANRRDPDTYSLQSENRRHARERSNNNQELMDAVTAELEFRERDKAEREERAEQREITREQREKNRTARQGQSRPGEPHKRQGESTANRALAAYFERNGVAHPPRATVVRIERTWQHNGRNFVSFYATAQNSLQVWIEVAAGTPGATRLDNKWFLPANTADEIQAATKPKELSTPEAIQPETPGLDFSPGEGDATGVQDAALALARTAEATTEANDKAAEETRQTEEDRKNQELAKLKKKLDDARTKQAFKMVNSWLVKLGVDPAAAQIVVEGITEDHTYNSLNKGPNGMFTSTITKHGMVTLSGRIIGHNLRIYVCHPKELAGDTKPTRVYEPKDPFVTEIEIAGTQTKQGHRQTGPLFVHVTTLETIGLALLAEARYLGVEDRPSIVEAEPTQPSSKPQPSPSLTLLNPKFWDKASLEYLEKVAKPAIFAWIEKRGVHPDSDVVTARNPADYGCFIDWSMDGRSFRSYIKGSKNPHIHVEVEIHPDPADPSTTTVFTCETSGQLDWTRDEHQRRLAAAQYKLKDQ